MPTLHFLGIRKSTIKKLPPFSYLFNWRDARVYSKVKKEIEIPYPVRDISNEEGSISLNINQREASIYFRKFPASDLAVFNQVFLRNCYHSIVEEMQKHFSANEALNIIDAGANVGYASVYFHLFFPSAFVISVEPEESNIGQLKKNIEANGFQHHEYIQGALWNRSAFLRIVKDFRDNRQASFTVKESDTTTGIRGYGFEEIMNLQNWAEVDLLKMDIEGSERFLFDTDANADAILSKIKFLAIEIHDEFDIRHTIYEHLKRNGFHYFEFDDLTLAVNYKKLNNVRH